MQFRFLSLCFVLSLLLDFQLNAVEPTPIGTPGQEIQDVVVLLPSSKYQLQCATFSASPATKLVSNRDARPSMRSLSRETEESKTPRPILSSEESLEFSIDSGFLFVDGEFIDAPYRLTETAAGFQINGHQFYLNEVRYGDSSKGGESTSQLECIHYTLLEDQVIVVFDGSAELLEYSEACELLAVLLDADIDSRESDVLTQVSLEQYWQYSGSREQWNSWISGFQPETSLISRAEPVVEEFRAIESANYAEIDSNRWLEQFGYLLTVAGMCLSVFSFGHLLQTGDQQGSRDADAFKLKAATISLALIACLSALDLIWTMMAYGSGQMLELNPLGNHVISEPSHLIAFKCLATSLSCTLLYCLRRHHSARMAAWWICLVCTILTFRWLMFNSMFVS